MSTSQNGWPVLPADSNLLHEWVIPASTGAVRLRLRNGSAGFVLAWVALRMAETVTVLRGKRLDEWGYAYRPIRGAATGYSNHASGTAMDLNAAAHPLGRVGTWGRTKTLQIRALLGLARLRHVVRWGGDYHGRKDEMHFELVGSPRACEAAARALMDTPRGRRLLAANPGQKALISP